MAGETVLGIILYGMCGSLLSESVSSSVRTLSEQFVRAEKEGQLPVNHDLARGVQRAAIRASLILLENAPTDELRTLRLGPNEIYPAWVTSPDEKLGTAKRWLERKYRALDPKKRLRSLPLIPSTYKTAIKETRLNVDERLALNWDPAEVARTDDEITDTWNEWKVQIVSEAIAIVIKAGGWVSSSKISMAQKLDKLFSVENAGWLSAFALSLAEELKSDERLHKIAVMIRFADVGKKIDDVLENQTVAKESAEKLLSAIARQEVELAKAHDRVLTSIDEKYERIENRLSEMTQLLVDLQRKPVFGDPGRSDRLQRFHFRNRSHKFLGREVALNNFISSFLQRSSMVGDIDKFAWTVVCGDAGVGKSRFADQILRKTTLEWPESGFVRESFLANVDLTPDWTKTLRGPTLLVVDYASGSPTEFINFMHQWPSLAKESTHPIRIVILLRKADDPIIERLRVQGNTELKAFSEAYVGWNEDDPEAPLKLAPLSEDETVALMRNRMALTARELDKSPHDLKDGELLSQLDRFDSARRPLFALIVADFWQRYGDLPSSSSSAEARIELFRDYINRERKNRWYAKVKRGGATGALTTDEQAHLDCHEALVRLSTMVRGLDSTQHLNLLDCESEFGPSYAALLPSAFSAIRDGVSDYDHQLLNAITASGETSIEDGKENYSILEPDLIGEYFVVEALLNMGQPDAKIRAQCLLRAAWQTAPDQMAGFARKVSQDYPQTAQTLNWLLPPETTPDNARPKSDLLRNLSADFAGELANRVINDEDVERFRQLIDAFDAPTIDAMSSDDEISRNYSLVLKTISQFLSKVINPTTKLRLDNYASGSEDNSANKREEFGSAAEDTQGRANSMSSEWQESGFVTENSADFDIWHDAEFSPALVLAAENLLKEICDLALPHSLSPGKIDTRLNYAEAVSDAVGSVFWDDKSKKGNCQEAPTTEELATRQSIAQEIIALTRISEVTEKDLACACRLATSMTYSDNSHSYGDLCHELMSVMLQFIGEDRVSDPQAMQSFFNFLRNFLAILFRSDEEQDWVKNYNQKDLFVRFLEPVLKLADQLQRSPAPYHLQSPVMRGLAGALDNLTYYWRKEIDPEAALLRKCSENFFATLIRHPNSRISTDYINYAVRLLSNFQSEKIETSEIESSVSAMLSGNEFDRQDIRSRDWTNRNFVRYTLLELLDTQPILVESVLSKLQEIEQDMKEGNQFAPLNDCLYDWLLNEQFGLSHARLARRLSGLDVGIDKAADNDMLPKLIQAIWAQEVMQGRFDNLIADIESHLVSASDTEGILLRTIALRGFTILIDKAGLDDEAVRNLRDRVERIEALGGPNIDPLAQRVGASLSSTDIRAHDLMLGEAISSIIHAETARGADISRFINMRGVGSK